MSGPPRPLVWLAGRFGYDLVRRTFYSPIPDLDQLPDGIFERLTDLQGVAIDPSAQMDWAEANLGHFVEEFEAPVGYQWANAFYEAGDAEIAYAIVRRLQPRRVMELGSGYSTLVLAHACSRNRSDGAPATFVNFDPYPSPVLEHGPVGLDEQRALRAQEIPLAEFEQLDDGDILFIDTSHTVKLGGDVNFLVLEVLPRLAPGVWVHFHDIWLPHEYHRVLVEQMRMFWAEQYLLQAFLSGNQDWEVVFAMQAVARAEPQRMEAFVPHYSGENFPSAFWIRRRKP